MRFCCGSWVHFGFWSGTCPVPLHLSQSATLLSLVTTIPQPRQSGHFISNSSSNFYVFLPTLRCAHCNSRTKRLNTITYLAIYVNNQAKFRIIDKIVIKVYYTFSTSKVVAILRNTLKSMRVFSFLGWLRVKDWP